MLFSSNRKCVLMLSVWVDVYKVIVWEKFKSFWVLCRREVFFFEEVIVKESEFKFVFVWNWVKVLVVKNCGFCLWFFFFVVKWFNCCVFVGILDVDCCVCVLFFVVVLFFLFYVKIWWVLIDVILFFRSKKKKKINLFL